MVGEESEHNSSCYYNEINPIATGVYSSENSSRVLTHKDVNKVIKYFRTNLWSYGGVVDSVALDTVVGDSEVLSLGLDDTVSVVDSVDPCEVVAVSAPLLVEPSVVIG